MDSVNLDINVLVRIRVHLHIKMRDAMIVATRPHSASVDTELPDLFDCLAMHASTARMRRRGIA